MFAVNVITTVNGMNAFTLIKNFDKIFHSYEVSNMEYIHKFRSFGFIRIFERFSFCGYSGNRTCWNSNPDESW